MKAQNTGTPLSCRIVEGARGALRAPWLLGAALVMMVGATGCVARTGAEVDVEEPVVEVETVPVAVESYPRYYYHGDYVYLVDGSWYHRHHGRWVTYTVEPRPLVDVRMSYQARFGAHYRPATVVASPTPRPHPRPHVHRH